MLQKRTNEATDSWINVQQIPNNGGKVRRWKLEMNFLRMSKITDNNTDTAVTISCKCILADRE